MYIPSIPTRQLPAARSSMSGTNSTGLVVGLAVVGSILALVSIFVMVRRLRIREAEPRLLPGRYMKNLWWKWTPGSRGGFNRNRQMTRTPIADLSPNAGLVSNNNDTTTSNPPQRGQSIRSIITLPPYSRLPKEEEQVIAREGEREGMDMVVEFPETNEEEENRREEEMESLYQIRLRRREELADREERRRLRTEARAAGDAARLRQLSRDSLAVREVNATRPSASAMLAEHQSRGRHQRISSVTYADIGHVRHDGSRIRANSNDSDQRPLLDTARQSTQSIFTIQSQARSSVSGFSTLSASVHSGDDDTPPSESAVEDGDLSTAHIPPPSYDYDDWGDAPAYESPISRTRGEAEHSLLSQTLPQIRIDAASPANSTLVSPAAAAAPTSHQSSSDVPENASHIASDAARPNS